MNGKFELNWRSSQLNLLDLSEPATLLFIPSNIFVHNNMNWAHIMHGTVARLLTKRLSIGALILSPWKNVKEVKGLRACLQYKIKMYLTNKNQADFSLPTNWSIEQLKPKAVASFMKAGVGTKF